MSALTEEQNQLLLHLQELHRQDKLFGMFTTQPLFECDGDKISQPNFIVPLDIPAEVYHHPDCPGVSNSNIETVERSYYHYLDSLDKARVERQEIDFRDKFFIGHAFHMFVLEPHIFEKTFVKFLEGEPEEPKFDKRTTIGKEGYAKWLKDIYTPWVENVKMPWVKENTGKVVLPKFTWDQLQSMGKAFLSHEKIKMILDSSLKEVTFFWTDPVTGITCKCRPDALSFQYGIILDAKSTEDASELGFQKAVAKWKYDRQAAFYQDGVREVTGNTYGFLFGAQEKTGLFLNQAFNANEAMLEVGQRLYRRGLNKLKSIHRGETPKGYSQEIVDLGLPSFAYDLSAR